MTEQLSLLAAPAATSAPGTPPWAPERFEEPYVTPPLHRAGGPVTSIEAARSALPSAREQNKAITWCLLGMGPVSADGTRGGGTAEEIAWTLNGRSFEGRWNNVIISRRISGLRLNHVFSYDGDEEKMYVKLFASILDSSVWTEPMEVRVLWVSLLAMADRDGFVRASPSGLARRANIDLPMCRKALKVLESPDVESSNQTWAGRRIEAIEGGWQILNYARFRDLADADIRREQVREAVRRHRARQSGDIAGNHPKAHTEADAAVEAEVDPVIAAAAREDVEADADTPSPVPSGEPLTYAQQCVIAANRALECRLGGAYKPLVATVEAETADAWQRDGVPLPIAIAAIAEAVRRYRASPQSRQPRSLRYFDGAVRDAWERSRAGGAKPKPVTDQPPPREPTPEETMADLDRKAEAQAARKKPGNLADALATILPRRVVA